MAEIKDSNPGNRDWKTIPREPIIMSTVENLRVLFEDNHIIAINKRNSDIIQSDISGDRTLCDVVKSYVKWKYNKPGLAFIGTVHRLDRPVSGIVLYSRTTKALNRLSNMFKFREVQKTYWAIVKGVPEEAEAQVINYLWKDEKQNKTFAFDAPAADRKESELSYKVMGVGDNYTFIEVYPKTGRHHQIRATMASLGCPIKGDIKYGSRRTNDNASIHLHARKIEFVHPVKKTPVTIIAPPPEDNLWDEFLRISLLNEEKINQTNSEKI
jgi:23S rRNA pseudouridine1911/1915/1917 synthase